VSLLVAEVSHIEGRGRLAVCLQLTGLITAGLLIAQLSPILQWIRVPLLRIVLQSSVLSAGAWMMGGAVTLGLYALCDQLFFQDWTTTEMTQAVLRTAATSVWFVPAVVLASVMHPGALAAALVLVYNVTRLLYGQWTIAAPKRDAPALETGVLFASAGERQPLLRDLAPRLVVSVCLQACLVAALMREYRLARMLFYASTAMVTMLVMMVREYRPETGSSVLRSAASLALSLLLAGGLTIGGLAPRAHGNGGTGSEKNGAPYPTAPAPEAGSVPQPSDNPNHESFPNDSFPGVILWPEIQPVPTLIAPIPAMHGGAPSTTPQRPFVIPFSGEYWMFRWPYARPPRNSYLKRGNPVTLSFRTTDHRPLQMEAHHKLDQAIDLRCCSQIQVAIRNSDHQPGAMSLELVLLDTEHHPSGRQSLGRATVMPVATDQKVGLGMPETLQFTVPANSALEEFNEFEVIFLRDPQQMDKSAKVAIERFVLVPR